MSSNFSITSSKVGAGLRFVCLYILGDPERMMVIWKAKITIVIWKAKNAIVIWKAKITIIIWKAQTKRK